MPVNHITGDALRRSLRMVIVATAFGMVFIVVITGSPLTGFARKLGAGDFLYGVLMAVPVIGGVFQLVTAYWLERLRRRKIVFVISMLCQRVLWIPIAFVPFFVPPHWPYLRIWTVICLLCLSSVSGAIGGVPFLSWMADLVPDQIRGRYFSRRSTVSTITACLGGLLAGYFLDLNNNFTGFAVVFSAAALFGLADILCFHWVDEPAMSTGKPVPFLSLVCYPFRAANFRRYMIFWAAWTFAINAAGPFFNVFMLEHLRLGYLQISLSTQLLSSLATVLFVRLWGRFADNYGNKPIMAICCTVASALPLLWLLTAPGSYYMVMVINFIAGAFWSGIEITYLNLLLGCSPERNRSMFVAAFTLFVSLIGGLAFLTGGLFLDLTRGLVQRLHWHLPGGHLTNYHLLFILSSLLRGMSVFALLPRLRDSSASAGHVVKEVLKGKARVIGKNSLHGRG